MRQARIFLGNEGDLAFMFLHMHAVQVVYNQALLQGLLNKTKYWQFFKQFLPKRTDFKHWFSSHQSLLQHPLNNTKRSILARQPSPNSRVSSLVRSTSKANLALTTNSEVLIVHGAEAALTEQELADVGSVYTRPPHKRILIK